MTISLKADAGGTFGEILVNGSQVAKFTPGGAAVIPGAVGTVSQSGGIPTGAIIEQGSNANGRFVRFADGTQICTFSTNSGVIASNATSGAANITFPVTFNSVPSVVAKASPASSNDNYGITSVQSVTTTTAVAVIRNGATAQSFSVFGIAIGRWF